MYMCYWVAVYCVMNRRMVLWLKIDTQKSLKENHTHTIDAVHAGMRVHVDEFTITFM